VAKTETVTTLVRILSGLCGILLLITAYYHSTGFEGVKSALSSAGISGFYADALPMQWLFFSWHLATLSIPLIWAALSGPSWFLPAAVFCMAVTFGDFMLVFSVAGWFPGTYILFVVAIVLFFVSVTLFKARDASAT
jgi:polyferredoxin